MGNCLESCLRGLVYGRRGYESIPEEEVKVNNNNTHKLVDLPSQFTQMYDLGKVIGTGTTSKVFELHRLHRDIRTYGDLACKVIFKKKLAMGISDIDVVLNQLRKEIDILRRVRHPNIVSYYDYLETKDYILIITERISGGELFDYLANKGPLTETQAKQAFYGIFSAVAYLHERGVIHRDIKSENIIFTIDVNGNFTLKLIDFGFSTIVRSALTGSFLGTGGYIAPEIRQQRKYSTSVDNWALGILLYCSLSARLPFGTSIDLLPADTHECEKVFKLIFPAQHWASVSESCKDLISQLLIVDPILRLSAKNALNHAWFQEKVVSSPFSSSILQSHNPFAELPQVHNSMRAVRSTIIIDDKRKKARAKSGPRQSRVFTKDDHASEALEKESNSSNISSHSSGTTTKEANSSHGSFMETIIAHVVKMNSYNALHNAMEEKKQPQKPKEEKKSYFFWDELHSKQAGSLFFSTMIESECV